LTFKDAQIKFNDTQWRIWNLQTGKARSSGAAGGGGGVWGRGAFLPTEGGVSGGGIASLYRSLSKGDPGDLKVIHWKRGNAPFLGGGNAPSQEGGIASSPVYHLLRSTKIVY